jgi:hypothetical protein
MKKIVIVVLTILAMLFSTLPATNAVAKKDTGNIFLSVRNRTGGPVHIVLTDANGKKIVFDYPAGMYREMLKQGVFSYYIITPCQKLTGVMNLNVSKQLYFGCDQGVDNEALAELSVQPAPYTPPAPVWTCLAWGYTSPPFGDGDFGGGYEGNVCRAWGWR